MILSWNTPSRIRHKQHVDWDHMTNWKLYYTYSKKAVAFSLDSLAHLKSIELNIDSMSQFLKGVKLLSPSSPPAWMGYFITSCRSPNGDQIKVIISHYGHFFFDVKNEKYYQLNELLAEDWKAYLNEKWTQLENSIIDQ